ncbi:MAG: hypothetical protein L3J83_00170 [Proteobacteria bacterium]|nr:hypothetical protein [Pseudomonadota bacterium]
MKILTLLVFLLLYQQSLACSCGAVPILDRMAKSDFIATVKILDLVPDQQKKSLANVNIEIINLYKGENVNKLKIRHSSESSCGLQMPIDSTWLIFAKKNSEGDLKIGACSQSSQLDKKFKPFIKQKYVDAYQQTMNTTLQILNYLNTKGINLSNEYKLRTFFTKQCFKDFNGIEVKENKFALYEVDIDSQLNIYHIEPLIEFKDERLQENLLNCLNESVKVYRKNKQTEIPSSTSIIVGLIYHPPIDGNESFIDEYNF